MLHVASASTAPKISTDHPDAELIALRTEFDRRVLRYYFLLEQAACVESLLDRGIVRPSPLTVCVGDSAMLRRHRIDVPENFYDAETVEKIRRANIGGLVPVGDSFAPCAEKSRASDIVAAFDDWQRERAALREELGFQSPIAAFDAACAIVDETRDAMATIPASTVEGLAAKAHAACRCLEGHYDTEEPNHDALVASILRDLLAQQSPSRAASSAANHNEAEVRDSAAA